MQNPYLTYPYGMQPQICRNRSTVAREDVTGMYGIALSSACIRFLITAVFVHFRRRSIPWASGLLLSEKGAHVVKRDLM